MPRQLDERPFFHGTIADLSVGELLTAIDGSSMGRTQDQIQPGDSPELRVADDLKRLKALVES